MNHVNAAFNDATTSIYTRVKKETRYPAGYFIQMVSEPGGLKVCRQLIRSPTPSEGFTTPWETSRLNSSMNYHVLLRQFEHLCDRHEGKIAYRRRRDYGVDVSVFDCMEDPV
jgi:hypothetical protein